MSKMIVYFVDAIDKHTRAALLAAMYEKFLNGDQSVNVMSVDENQLRVSQIQFGQTVKEKINDALAFTHGALSHINASGKFLLPDVVVVRGSPTSKWAEAIKEHDNKDTDVLNTLKRYFSAYTDSFDIVLVHSGLPSDKAEEIDQLASALVDYRNQDDRPEPEWSLSNIIVAIDDVVTCNAVSEQNPGGSIYQASPVFYVNGNERKLPYLMGKENSNPASPAA